MNNDFEILVDNFKCQIRAIGKGVAKYLCEQCKEKAYKKSLKGK